nr:MAG TPA: hypothetical protein [Caudoviricetes sp.]
MADHKLQDLYHELFDIPTVQWPPTKYQPEVP